MSKVDRFMSGCLIAGIFIGIFACSLFLTFIQGGIFTFITILAACASLYIGYILEPLKKDIENGNL